MERNSVSLAPKKILIRDTGRVSEPSSFGAAPGIFFPEQRTLFFVRTVNKMSEIDIVS